MEKFDRTKLFYAQEGKVFQRISDGFIMGAEMYLEKTIDGENDVFENYAEIDKPEGYE